MTQLLGFLLCQVEVLGAKLYQRSVVFHEVIPCLLVVAVHFLQQIFSCGEYYFAKVNWGCFLVDGEGIGEGEALHEEEVHQVQRVEYHQHEEHASGAIAQLR